MEASLRVKAEVYCVKLRAVRRFQKRRFEWLRYLTGISLAARIVLNFTETSFYAK